MQCFQKSGVMQFFLHYIVEDVVSHYFLVKILFEIDFEFFVSSLARITGTSVHDLGRQTGAKKTKAQNPVLANSDICVTKLV